MSDWADFYVIVGSSGGALIGLQFVVMTLLAGKRQSSHTDALSAFGTPTVVHLTGTLLVSAIMSAPWPSLVPLSIAIGACGAGGLVYGAIVINRARRQTEYEPVWQDWLWYHLMPCAAYGTLAITSAFLRTSTRSAPFAIAGAALGLLLIGIHNAWDTVTHIIVTNSGAEP
jgi:hypothetical protein